MSIDNKYHPFNSLKSLTHVEYWKPILSRRIPPPRLVSIDPCGFCDYACPFCNSAEIMQQHSAKMSMEMMAKIVTLLSEWKTKAVCVGGGGESLLNENVSYLLTKLVELGIDVGVVTNGTHIPQHLDALSKCKWVAISMDAGCKETYMKMKGISSDKWEYVIQNIRLLSRTGVETTWKFLVHPENYAEILDACIAAKQAGCTQIHIRPGSHTWFSPRENKSFLFPAGAVDFAREQIREAKSRLQDDTFRVYAVEDKFNSQWGIKKSFSKCYAVFTNCFIDAKGTVGLCCDRKGDPHLILGTLDDIREKWGSNEHWKIHEHIKVEHCPRCTLVHVNEIFENVIIDDKMFYNMF